jgi:hypothetical protein
MRALDIAGRWKPGRTFAQTLAALLGADGLGLLDVDWDLRAVGVPAWPDSCRH